MYIWTWQSLTDCALQQVVAQVTGSTYRARLALALALRMMRETIWTGHLVQQDCRKRASWRSSLAKRGERNGNIVVADNSCAEQRSPEPHEADTISRQGSACAHCTEGVCSLKFRDDDHSFINTTSHFPTPQSPPCKRTACQLACYTPSPHHVAHYVLRMYKWNLQDAVPSFLSGRDLQHMWRPC